MSEINTYALEPLYVSNRHLLCNESQIMLNEGMKEVVMDALQYIVGAISEYGLVATVGGAPAGPVLETITDAGFMAESVAAALASIGDVISMFGELAEIVKAIFALTLGGGFDSFYDEVRSIWQRVSDLLPDTAEEKIEELIEGAKKTINDILGKFGDFVSDAIKLAIPEATIGTGVGEAVQKLLMTVAENAYSLLTTIIEQLGRFQKVVTSPDAAAKLFNDIFDGIDELLEKVQKKMEEEPEGIAGIFDKVTSLHPGKAMQDVLAEKALAAFRDFVADKRPVILALVDKIVRIMFPAIFALLASYQILMKDEWKTKKEIGDDDAKSGLTPGRGGRGENSLDVLLAAGRSRSFETLTEVTGGGIGVPQPTGYGPNYHTVNTDPITWENLEGPEYFVTSQPDGSVLAGVSLPGTNLATPAYEFKDEASAMSWVRNTFEKYRREFMAQESPPR